MHAKGGIKCTFILSVLVGLLVAPVSADAGIRIKYIGPQRLDMAMQKHLTRPPISSCKALEKNDKTANITATKFVATLQSRVAREEVIIRAPNVESFAAVIQRYRSFRYDVSTYR